VLWLLLVFPGNFCRDDIATTIVNMQIEWLWYQHPVALPTHHRKSSSQIFDAMVNSLLRFSEKLYDHIANRVSTCCKSRVRRCGDAERRYSPMERVYIGGFDPSRGLSVDEIVQRIQRVLVDDVIVVDVNYRCHPCTNDFLWMKPTTYCHLTVHSKQKERISSLDDDPSLNTAVNDESITSLSAYAKIAKLFHNVTWKNCKLKVAVARPHFLERLKQEQLSRNHVEWKKTEQFSILNSDSLLVDQSQTVVDSHNHKVVSSSSIRRHWRVRSQYGQQAWMVDTKPCLVKDWHSLSVMRRRYESGRQKFQSVVQTTGKETTRQTHLYRSKSQYNRAIHMRFDDMSYGVESSTQVTDENCDSDHDRSDGSDHDTSDLENLSHDQHDQGRHHANDLPKREYEWSDDSSTEHEATDDSSENESGSTSSIHLTAAVDLHHESDLNMKLFASLFPEAGTETPMPSSLNSDNKKEEATATK
jgi:hypothetical protein